jgi:hypothetical protein
LETEIPYTAHAYYFEASPLGWNPACSDVVFDDAMVALHNIENGLWFIRPKVI